MSHSYRSLQNLTLASAIAFAGVAPAVPVSTSTPLPVVGPRKVDCSYAESMKEIRTLVGQPLPANNASGVTLRIIKIAVTSPNTTVANPCDDATGKTHYTFNFRASVHNAVPEKSSLIVNTADLRCELIGKNTDFDYVGPVKLADVKLTFHFRDVHRGETGISDPTVGNPVDPRPGDPGAHNPDEFELSVFFPHATLDPDKCRVLINV